MGCGWVVDGGVFYTVQPSPLARFFNDCYFSFKDADRLLGKGDHAVFVIPRQTFQAKDRYKSHVSNYNSTKKTGIDEQTTVSSRTVKCGRRFQVYLVAVAPITHC